MGRKRRVQNVETGEVLTGGALRRMRHEQREEAAKVLNDIFEQLKISPEDFKKEYDRLVAFSLDRDKDNYNREMQALMTKAREKNASSAPKQNQ